MFLKNRVWNAVILVTCGLVIGFFDYISQINLLFQISIIYFIVCFIALVSLFISIGIKRLHETKQKEQHSRWSQNFFIFLGIGIALLPVLEFSGHLWDKNFIGHTGVWIVDLIEIILASVFLVFMLSFEVILTTGFILSILNKTSQYLPFFRDVPSNGRSLEKQLPDEKP